ncbi:MAG TPA: pilus assembly protein TadG-related protein [Arsenicitalea sp.]|jgi:Flp pilus assembly protein TadG|nr:pilus assembly protein TadG-related protein [Arsenicitalea sp.]
MHALLALLKRFRSDERGAFAIIFAVMAIVLVATSGAVVDYTSVAQARTRAQVALDAAALALQPQIYVAGYDIKGKAQAALLERLADGRGAWNACTGTTPVLPCGSVDTVTTDTVNGTLTLAGRIIVPMNFVSLVGVQQMTVAMTSQSTRGSLNIEVALALDTTGSMAGTKISDLQAATKQLISLVVKDVQTPTYSKMAIVPYSVAVNMSSYAASVRGPVIGAKAITDISWASSPARAITTTTKTNPVVVNADNTFSNGDRVYIDNVTGMSQLNGRVYTVANATTTSFALQSVNGSNYNSSGSGGTVTRCQATNCELVVTAISHGLANNDNVYILNTNGIGSINRVVFSVSQVTPNTYALVNTSGPDYGTYTSGGSSYCTKQGCQYYYFATGMTPYQINNCVSERTTNAYTDDPPTTTLLGRDYTSGGSACMGQTITPLTTDKTVLNAAANSLTANGSTAGHIGLAWAWYMLSPNFAYLWPNGSQGAAYTAPNTLKAVVLMTDGEFNTAYCKDVISKDSGGSINCNAPNGNSLVQAAALCTAIKATGTILYTVGFQLDTQSAITLLSQCATDTAHFYNATTGTDLSNAFEDIGRTLSALRVSR